MAYEVEVTDEWLEWFNQLTAEEQDEIERRSGSSRTDDLSCRFHTAVG